MAAAPATSKAPAEPSRDPIADVEIVPDNDPHAGDDPAFLTEGDAASSTQSLSSSVLNYQYENGRRYHSYREGEYTMPNDDREQDRLDLHHHIFRMAVGGALFRAPVNLANSARILDLGTGTGIWAIEMADEFPHADIIGTDLSPIQPGWVPPNCFFEVNDYESDWDFTKPFDFIHARNLQGSVRDLPSLYQHIKNNLNPGGMQRAPNLTEWVRLQHEASAKFGKGFDVARHHRQRMIDAGFKNVKEDVYKVPLNPWPKDRKLKDIGRYQQVNMIEGMEAYSLALFTRFLGWSIQETQAFFSGVRGELVDRSLHVYTKFYFVYGQKE